MTPITNGGSNRQYFRDGDHIHVIGTNRAENHAFITMARHFRACGLPVPEVYQVSEDEMQYDLQDLGNLSLFDAIASGRESGCFNDTEKALLATTIRTLAHFQIEGDKGLDYSICFPQPAFNRRSILWDLNYFKYCYLKATHTEFLEDQLEDDFDHMADILLQTPIQAFMYRDFQSRNIMVLPSDSPTHQFTDSPSIAFIDFQGGRRGPVHYDVASFLWQAKANLPQTLRDELIDIYLDELQTLIPVDRVQFKRDLIQFVFFRTLQVLGAYGFRGFFERKPHFLQSIPFALNNLRELLPAMQDKYPYLCHILADILSSSGELSGSLCCLSKVGLAPLATSCPSGDKPNGQTIVIKKESIENLTIDIYSFSYKKGIPTDPTDNGGGFVFDCRAPHNPGRYEQYKHMTGLDESVIRFIEEDGELPKFLESVYQLVDAAVSRYLERGFTHLMVSFGCTGGQHRSVYSAEHLAQHLHDTFHQFTDSPTPRFTIQIHHREQGIDRTL